MTQLFFFQEGSSGYHILQLQVTNIKGKNETYFQSFTLVYYQTGHIQISKSFSNILLIQIRVVLQSDLRKLPQDSGMQT